MFSRKDQPPAVGILPERFILDNGNVIHIIACINIAGALHCFARGT